MKKYLPIFFGIVLLGISAQKTSADVSYTVTGTVGPTVANFPFSISQSPVKTYYKQDDIITYTITYGTTMGGEVPNYTIVAKWNNDTPPTTTFTDILEYVSGSGSNAYGDTPPVVDTMHNQISWTVPSLLGPISNQTVSFQLKLNNNYQNTLPVNFTVSSHIETPYLTTPVANLLGTYRYDPTYLPNLHAATPTPTPLPQKDRFTDIRINTITATSAQITANTYYSTTATLFFNNKLKGLTNTVVDTVKKQNHDFAMQNLKPNTRYYFQVIANDGAKKLYSEFYTFTTATSTQTPLVTISPIIITQNNNVLFTTSIDNNAEVIIPTNTMYQLTFGLDKPVQLNFAHAHIQSPNEQRTISLTQKQSNQYSGELLTEGTPQTENLQVILADIQGNLFQQHLITMHVVTPFKVVDETGQGIEHANVLFTVLNSQNHYEKLVLNSTDNPLFSDTNGMLHIALPKGSYKAEVSADGYATQTVLFTLEKDGYPTVVMKKSTWSLWTFIKYLLSILLGFFSLLTNVFIPLTISKRLYDLFGFISLSGFVLLSFILLYVKTHFHLKSLPALVALQLFPTHGEKLVVGKVVDDQGKPLTKVIIVLLDEHKIVRNQTLSNKNGTFLLPRPKHHAVITCLKQGYLPESLAISPADSQLVIQLEKTQVSVKQVITKTASALEFVGGMFFEVALLFSVLLELGFLQNFGATKVLPFLLLSLLNAFLGIVYLKDRARH